MVVVGHHKQQPSFDRVRRRIVLKKVGKPLLQASSPIVLVKGLLGGLKGERVKQVLSRSGRSHALGTNTVLRAGHQSLLEKAGILHRDISTGNIMLEEAETHSFLIDLDLAIHYDRQEASGAPARTGTKVFMASRALMGCGPHSFVYDLESFFWILFWICIPCTGPKGMRRHDTEFEKWNYMTWSDLAIAKDGLILSQHFERTLNANISQYCRPLLPIVLELHATLFPDGRMPSVADKSLYWRMERIFLRGIDNLSDSIAVE
jgi:serine/threonine protein kinase